MRILLTNDDGIHAPGLLAMWRELIHLGEVDVVAPAEVQSATGHGVTITSPLMTETVTIEGGFTGTAVSGRPADCVKLAIAHLVAAPPDLVVSGINSGANVGINVIYSGTVAAAIEAAFLGLPAIATSLYLRKDFPNDYAVAAKITADVIRKLLAAGLNKGDVASINIPALRDGQSPAGVKFVRQCTRAWNDTYDRRLDPRGRAYYWNSSVFKLGETEDDTDVAALREGYVTVTPLQFDLTSHETIKRWSVG